jgi:Skp family chaperone for outer membrane proteins
VNNRKSRYAALALVLLGGLVAGCQGRSGSAGVAVIDLVAAARATGQDKAMEAQMESARTELAAQLTQIAGDLEKTLQAEQSRLGGPAKAADSKEFQQLAAQARQQFAQTQALAQKKAQDYQLGLLGGFRQLVEPIAAEIARSRGAGVVLAADPTMMWFEPALDITDEVIAALRARPVAPAPSQEPAGESSQSEAQEGDKAQED